MSQQKPQILVQAYQFLYDHISLINTSQLFNCRTKWWGYRDPGGGGSIYL